MTKRFRAVLILLALVAAACSGDDATGTTVGVTATTAATTTTTMAPATTTTTEPDGAADSSGEAGPTTTSTTTTTPDTSEPPEDVERIDLLTFAQGTVFVRQTGETSGAQNGLQLIDGNRRKVAVSSDGAGPIEFIYKLPADTVFDRFAVPNVVETPGNVTFIRSVMVSGSQAGPDSGFEVLVDLTLETHENPGEDITEVVPEVQTPVRWIKVNLGGGINIEPGDEGKTVLEFSEIVGNGTQEAAELSTAFTGIWAFRLTERLDLAGKPLQLTQTGATIAGCLDTIAINGSVNGRIARANGIDTARNDRPSAFIFVADEDGSIQAVWSENNSLFDAMTAVVDPDVTSTPCSEEPPEPQFCGLSVYVNFDFNSATIRPDSEQVLADLYAGLVADGVRSVAIEGHTSTEGSEAYNLDLSERRAAAVVDDLIARGFEASGISAVGKGETEPLRSPDDDESSRSINRRVEVVCG